MKYVIKFHLNKKEDIELTFTHPLRMIACCYDTTVVLVNKRSQLIIGEIDTIQLLKQLIANLSKALSKQLYLHNSLENNVGMIENEHTDSIFNEYSKVKRTFVEKKNTEGTVFWIGYDYTLCGFRHRQAWLYNDQYGNIILEVTPCYHSLIKRRKKKISFTRWMKTKYKPILKRIIKREVADEWITLAKNMLSMIRENIPREFEK